jgi:subtilisin family serine protease
MNMKGWISLVFLIVLVVSTYVGVSHIGAEDLGAQPSVDAGSVVAASSSTTRYRVTLVTGVVVVVAAGNAYDCFAVETPGVARTAITVGASDMSEAVASFSSRGPTLDFRVKPDVVALAS